MKRTIIRFLIVSLVLVTTVTPLWSSMSARAASYPLSTSDARIVAALDFIRNSEAEHPKLWAGGEKTCYAIVAIEACGGDAHTFLNSDGVSMVDTIRNQASKYLKPEATASLAHEYYLLAIVAAGEDPWNFGGINVAGQLLDMFNGTQIGQTGIVNDDFWAIISLVGAGVKPSHPTIQAMRQFIISCQNADGGWGCNVDGSGMSAGSDPCDTSNAIMALVAAGESPSSAVIQNAFAYIKSCQNDDGGFPYYDGTAASDSGTDARVIAAIMACGGDPTGAEWTANGNNPFTHALSLQNDDGGFAWIEGGSTDAWMTTYIMPPLVGKYWPTNIISDNTVPVITNMNPSEDEFVTDVQPTISVTFSDTVSGIDVNAVTLTVDGNEVTTQAVVTETGLTYTPAETLQDGTVQVVLSVADRTGNTATAVWGFTVDADLSTDDNPPEITSVEPEDNTTISTVWPEITITYTDDISGIDTDSVTLRVNNEDVTSVCNITEERLVYMPQADMEEGAVVVRVGLRDKAGNTAYYNWEFAIDTAAESGDTSGTDTDTNDATTIEDTPATSQDDALASSAEDQAQQVSYNLQESITADGTVTGTIAATSKDGAFSITLDEGVTVLRDDQTPPDVLTIEADATAPALPEGFLPVGLTYRVGPDEAVIQPTAQVTVTYQEKESDSGQKIWDVNCDGAINVLDVAMMREESWDGRTAGSFFIACYDAVSEEWLCLDGTHDASVHTVTAEVARLTLFTLVCALTSTTDVGEYIEPVAAVSSSTVDVTSVTTGDISVSSADATRSLEISSGTSIMCDGTPVDTITIETGVSTPAMAADYARIGTACELGPDGTTFDKPVVLTFFYEESVSREFLRWDSNGDGTVDFLDKDTYVAPEDFCIAYYNTATATWVFLESTVDREAKTVAAEVDHFTLFALVAPATEPLNVKSIDINPDSIELGEEITITVTVENPGEHRGTYVVPLAIEGVFEGSQEVTLTPGEHEIVFMHKEPYTGTHEVSVLGETAEFAVNENTTGSSNWWDSVDVVFYLYIIIGVLCVVIIAGVIILARIWRRKAN